MAEVQVDRSRLPPVQEVCREFAVLEDGALAHSLQEQEVEQYYAANVQKSQRVQKDIRVAKELQGVEDAAAEDRLQGATEQQEQSEERDSRMARALQEDLRRRPRESRRRRQQREERGQETAQWLQEEEEEEEEAGRQQKWRLGHAGQTREDDAAPLNAAMAALDLQSRELLRQDEMLARRLQREEQTRQRARRNLETAGDYRAAQVAQDEEIAHYMQEQELEARRRILGLGRDAGETHRGPSEPGWSRDREEEEVATAGMQEEAPGSGEGGPRTRIQSLGRRPEVPAGGSCAAPRAQLGRNIAELLDPTFKAKSPEASAGRVATPCCQGRPIPVDGFFDYLDEAAEPALVSPSRRQPEKASRQKSREKKEGCKQQ